MIILKKYNHHKFDIFIIGLVTCKSSTQITRQPMGLDHMSMELENSNPISLQFHPIEDLLRHKFLNLPT